MDVYDPITGQNILYAMYQEVMGQGDTSGLRLRSISPFMVRDYLCKKYAWAIPTKEAVEFIAQYSPIIEMGAGSGYWANLINLVGGNIIAFDEAPPNEVTNRFFKEGTTFFSVKQGTPEIVSNYPNHTLFLCWPPYDSSMAYETLKAYKGNVVIYVGEGSGGCTGDDQFHDLLEKEWTMTNEIKIPQWYGIHDWLYLYSRK
jgi:hypothetical protein